MSEAARQIPEKEDSSLKTTDIHGESVRGAQCNLAACALHLRAAPTASGRANRDSLLRRLPFRSAPGAQRVQSVMPTTYPCVPGHEIVGRVVKVAEPSRNSRKATSPQSVAWWTLAASAQVVSLGKSSFVRSS